MKLLDGVEPNVDPAINGHGWRYARSKGAGLTVRGDFNEVLILCRKEHLFSPQTAEDFSIVHVLAGYSRPTAPPVEAGCKTTTGRFRRAGRSCGFDGGRNVLGDRRGVSESGHDLIAGELIILLDIFALVACGKSAEPSGDVDSCARDTGVTKWNRRIDCDPRINFPGVSVTEANRRDSPRYLVS